MNGLEIALGQARLVEKYSGNTASSPGVGVVAQNDGHQSGQPKQSSNLIKDRAAYNNDGGELDLYGATPPQFEILKESPEHRFLLYLFAQGNSTMEVYQQLGGQVDPITKLPLSGTGRFSYHWLCQIRRQSWFREQLTKFLHSMGTDMVQAKLKTELMPSLEVVVKLRDDENVPGSVRLNAANSLIDRYLGKPVQHVVTENLKSVDSYTKDAETLKKELAQVEREMDNLNKGAKEMLNGTEQ